MRFFHLVSTILLLQILAAWTAPVGAESESSIPAIDTLEQQPSTNSQSHIERQIRTYDRQIFLELTKLAEFNVRFQQTVNHRSRWRDVAYPLAQEATYACFLGYSITDISQRSRGWNNPRLISKPTIKVALSTAAVGSMVGCTSSAVELAANGFEAARAKRMGFSVRESVTFVQATVNQVDDLLSKRHSLMNEFESKGTRRELMELKEQLICYERDRLVFEFTRWSGHSRGYFWYRNAFYLINSTVNLARFSAIELGLNSFSHPKCSGATGPILTTSACLAGLGPLLSSAVGKCVEHHHRRSMSKKLPVSRLLSDQEAKQKFERLAQLLADNQINSQHGQLTSELIRLREEKIGLDTLIDHEDRNIERLRRVAGQQAITAPLISTLGAGSGILSTIAYHGYRQRTIISNRLGLAGDATIIPAEAVALVATPAAAILAYRYECDLKKKGEHPDQLLAKRLEDLKALEKMVTDAWR